MYRLIVPLGLALATLQAQESSSTLVQPHRRSAASYADAFQKAVRASLPSRRFALPEFAAKRLAPLSKAQLQPDAAKRAAQAGVHRTLDSDTLRFARWEALPDGRSLWRLRVESPEAAGIRVHFRNFDAGRGRVWLHDGSGSEAEIQGPYTARGPFGDGDFWSDFVLSASAVIEFEPAAAPLSPVDAPPFEVAGISHLLPGVLTAPQAGEPTPLAAANCHLDSTCYPEWAETAKSVGHIVFEEEGKTYVCSGTLLATRNRSGIPYFLTADHCIADDATARTMQVFWLYQSSTCNGAPADRRGVPRTLGARYLAGGGMGRGDYTLVQLASVPDSAVYSGWDVAEQPMGTAVTGIHHPTGDYKRISFGQRIRALPGLPGTNLDYFYSIAFDRGKVEGGSSGSGIFSRPGVLVGTLTWGPKAEGANQICNFQPLNTGYGRFATHYTALKDYLDGRTTTPGTDPAPPPNQTAPGTELISGRAANVSLAAVSSATLFTGERGYYIRVPQGATRVELSLRMNGSVGLVGRMDQTPTVADGRAVSDYTSSGYTGQESIVITAASTPALRAGVLYLGFADFAVNQALTGTLLATVTAPGGTATPPPATGGGRVLTSGTAAPFSFAAVASATLLNGTNGFQVQVPAGATRLEIRLATSTANADVDLYVRQGQDVVVQSSQAMADHVSEGPAGAESVIVTAQSDPPLRPGTYFIAFGIFTRNTAINGTVTATVTGAAQPPPATNPPATGGGTPLVSGAPRAYRLAPMALPTLINGAQGYTIQVPPGATRLDLRLATTTPNVDVDLLARFGADPSATSGKLEADHNSSGPDGNESIVITAQSNPPLRAGTYYIALAMFSKGVPAEGTLTAAVTAPGAAPPAGGGRVIAPGTPVTFNLPAVDRATLLSGPQGYTIQVPAGATRLELQLSTVNPQLDVDLFVRKNLEPSAVNGKVIADYSSTGPQGAESIVITVASNPPLAAGTYHVALGVFTAGLPVAGTLRATLTGAGAPATPAGGLQSGAPASFNYDAVTSATLFRGARGFYIDLPANAQRLDVRLNTATPGADVDLFVRHGQDIGIENGRVVADFAAEGPTGIETIGIGGSSEPPLQAGRYYIALAMFTPGVAVSGSVTATVVLPAVAAPKSSRDLQPGVASKFSLPARPRTTLFTGDYGYKLTVPEGISRVRLDLRSSTPGADVDLYVRYEEDVDLADGSVIADYGAEGDTGDETIVIDASSAPALRPGTYYIGFANYAVNVEVHASLTVELERASLVPPLSSARQLVPGVPARFELPAVDSPALFQGEYGYRVTVPSGAASLEIELHSDQPVHDVDLFVRQGRESAVEQGRVVADASSTGDTGVERIAIANPAPGVYFVNLGLFSTGVRVAGSLTATVTGALRTGSGELPKLSEIDKEAAGTGEEGDPVAAKPVERMLAPLGPAAKDAVEPRGLRLPARRPKAGAAVLVKE